MKRPGDILRRQRQKLGLSLQELESSSNIPYRSLEALESDQYDFFAAESYYCGFLRNYAESLKLDPQILLNAYKKVKIIESPMPMQQLTGNFPKNKTSRLVLLMIVLLLIIGGGIVTYLIAQRASNIAKTAVEPTISAPESPQEQEESTQNTKEQTTNTKIVEPEFSQNELNAKFRAFEQQELQTAPQVIIRTNRPLALQVQLTFQRDSYIRYLWAGQRAQEFPVLKGKPLLLQGEAPLTLWISDVKSTQVKINGQILNLQAFQNVFIGRLEWTRRASEALLYLSSGSQAKNLPNP